MKLAEQRRRIYDPKFFFWPLAENTCEAHLNTRILEFVSCLKKSSGNCISISSLPSELLIPSPIGHEQVYVFACGLYPTKLQFFLHILRFFLK